MYKITGTLNMTPNIITSNRIFTRYDTERIFNVSKYKRKGNSQLKLIFDNNNTYVYHNVGVFQERNRSKTLSVENPQRIFGTGAKEYITESGNIEIELDNIRLGNIVYNIEKSTVRTFIVIDSDVLKFRMKIHRITGSNLFKIQYIYINFG